jgi:hypothetical protein
MQVLNQPARAPGEAGFNPVTKFADGRRRQCKTLPQGRIKEERSHMDLSKAVACSALVIIVVLSAGHALSQDKPPAPADDAAAKKEAALSAQAERERAAEQKRLARKQLDEEISRRCVIKPVMTDAEIDACRLAYRL